jgi:DNA-binding MarR family transcriptional regulator
MDTKKTIDLIVENLFYALPVIHKRLMRIEPPNLNCGMHLSRLHMGTLAVLHENIASISEIANTFLIPKSQMSYIIDRMVEAGLVERIASPDDRRVTNVALTPKGQATFQQCDAYIKNNVREMLSALTANDLEDFLESLIKLKAIGPKLGDKK